MRRRAPEPDSQTSVAHSPFSMTGVAVANTKFEEGGQAKINITINYAAYGRHRAVLGIGRPPKMYFGSTRKNPRKVFGKNPNENPQIFHNALLIAGKKTW